MNSLGSIAVGSCRKSSGMVHLSNGDIAFPGALVGRVCFTPEPEHRSDNCRPFLTIVLAGMAWR